MVKEILFDLVNLAVEAVERKQKVEILCQTVMETLLVEVYWTAKERQAELEGEVLKVSKSFLKIL